MVFVTAAIALGNSIFYALGIGATASLGVLAAVGFAGQIALGLAIRALTPKPKFPEALRGYQVNSRGSALDHQIIYGKVRVGGAIVYDESTGTNNKFLHRIIAVSGHEVESFDRLYINDSYVDVANIGADGNVSAVIDSDGSTSDRFDGKLRVNFHLGASDQDADPDLVAESAKWTAQHRLRGIAYMYVRLQFDADVFPNGVPTFTAEVKGKKVYNPSTGTTVWSDNPALCLRDYLTSSYGLAELPANIDDTLINSAVAVCNQTNTDAGTTRYTCNGAFTTNLTPYDAINNILTSMGGTLWYAQGKWRVKPSYWTAPVLDLNEDDLRSSIGVSTRHSRRDNFNVVKGTFRGEESNWQTTDYPQVDSPAFLAADNNQESVADVDLPFTDNSVEARRIARIALERNRQQLTVTAAFGLNTMQVQVGDNVRLTNTRFGWTNKEFEVLSWTFGLTDGLDLQVNMNLRETAESVFDEVDDGVVYERDNTLLDSPFSVPNLGLSAVTRTQVIREKLTNIIQLTVTSAAGERVDHVEAQFKLSSDTNWISLGTGQLGDFNAVDLEDGDYDFRARAINTFGIRGAWSELDDVSASGLLEPPQDVTGFVAEVNGSVINLDWNPVPDLDLSFYRIRFSPDITGATWANSTTYVDKVPRPASSVSIPARSGTYLVRAYDKSGIGSANYTSVIVPVADIQPLANTLTLTDSPTFSGTKTDVEMVGLNLRLDDYASAPSEGEYFFSNYIETGDNTVKRCRVYASALSARHDASAGLFDDAPGKFNDAVGFFDDLGGNAQFADTDVSTFVSTTQDDPAGSPTWSAYTLIKVADISARAFRFKIKLSSTSNNVTPSISALTAYVEYN
tara:strand:+ start:631 stop:3186 length:2556 start_codon:yes stop_codon:yes gene_type:complete